MTVKELREKLKKYDAHTPVHIVIEAPYITDEMDSEFPGWEDECILYFDVAHWPCFGSR